VIGVIKTILLWLVFVTNALGVPYRLYQVAEGKHEHIEDPLINAIGAVIDAVFVVLFWIYVLQ